MLTTDNRPLMEQTEMHLTEAKALREKVGELKLLREIHVRRIMELESENRMLCELLVECSDLLQTMGVSMDYRRSQ